MKTPTSRPYPMPMCLRIGAQAGLPMLPMAFVLTGWVLLDLIAAGGDSL